MAEEKQKSSTKESSDGRSWRGCNGMKKWWAPLTWLDKDDGKRRNDNANSAKTSTPRNKNYRIQPPGYRRNRSSANGGGSRRYTSSSFASRFLHNGDVEDFRPTDDHASADSDDESEVRSMTAKGINHLCSELLELKAESNGDFHRIIISSCLSFSRAFERVKEMEQDLMHLKSTISTHTSLVKDLMDGIGLDIESDETVDPTHQASECNRLIELEAHIYEISNALDNLIYENKIDEALETIKLEDENLQRLKVEEEDYLLDIVMLYDCVISDKNAKINLQLAKLKENGKMLAGGEASPTADQPPSIDSQVPE